MYIIETKNLYKKYGSQVVSNHINLQIEKNGIYGLVGPNGAGKTTLIKMLAGLNFPTDGEIYFYEKTGEKALAEGRKKMSFMIETPYAKLNLTARQNLEIQRIQKGIKDKSRVDEVLELVGLNKSEKKTVKQCSLGMRQRLGIANALLSSPEILVLDEPVNGLDPEGMAEMRELIIRLQKQGQVTVVISSHIMSELSQMCTNYIFIRRGTVIKEMDNEELLLDCKRRIEFRTDHNERTVQLMRDVLKTNQYQIMQDGTCRLYEYLHNPYAVARAIIDCGMTPIYFCEQCESLENYYSKLMGVNSND